MSDMGVAFVLGPCISCGKTFAFDPDKVPSVMVKHGTGRPYGRPPEYDPEHGVREPICPECCKAANPERWARGFELLPEHDTLEAMLDDVRRYGP